MPESIKRTPPVVITIDVEDWPQSTLDSSLAITVRASTNTSFLLDLLAKYQKPVTLFVLGLFAERFPKLVVEMSKLGHEVACHGYNHIPIFRQSPDEFRRDIKRAKNLLEDITGNPVRGYRAPDFSVMSSTLWALEIIAETGFEYDSSIFPMQLKRYGIADWSLQPSKVLCKNGLPIIEIPLSVIKWTGKKWPVAGGGYHRLLPTGLIRWSVTRVLDEGRPFIAYCHPYEFDIDELKQLPHKIPLKLRLSQSLGRRGFQKKFESLLNDFSIMPAYQAGLIYSCTTLSV